MEDSDMNGVSVRELTRMMMDEDHPEAFEVCDYTGNYSGERIRFPGFSPETSSEGVDLNPTDHVRGDCSTEAWFADKDCKWLVFQDTDGDVAIIHIHALIKQAEEKRKEFDSAKAEESVQ